MPSRDATPLAPQRPTRRRARMLRRGPSTTFGFTVRLALAIAATFVLLGTAGYLMVGGQLQRRLIETYAAEHRADARSVADAELRSATPFEARERIGELVDAIARRPDVSDATLIR